MSVCAMQKKNSRKEKNKNKFHKVIKNLKMIAGETM